MDFIPHDNKTINEMLNVIGVKSLQELFQDIPKDLIIDKLKMPSGLSESDLFYELKKISQKNKIYKNTFLGAGTTLALF